MNAKAFKFLKFHKFNLKHFFYALKLALLKNKIFYNPLYHNYDFPNP